MKQSRDVKSQLGSRDFTRQRLNQKSNIDKRRCVYLKTMEDLVNLSANDHGMFRNVSLHTYKDVGLRILAFSRSIVETLIIFTDVF